MKNFYQKFFGMLLIFTFSAALLFGQIPTESPLPVDVSIVGSNSGPILVDDYGSTVDEGSDIPWSIPFLTQTLTGELVWARDDGMYDPDMTGMPSADSLNCSWGTTMDNVAGKIAAVRRGACFFSQKVYNAQEAGAVAVVLLNNDVDNPDQIINMLGGDSAAAVTIPVISLTYNNSIPVAEALDAGDVVTVTFEVNPFLDAIGPTAFQIPSSQVTTFDSIRVSLFNSDPDESIFDVDGKVDIIEPDGNITTLDAVWPIIEAENIETATFPPYTPEDFGLYTMIYTNSLSSDTLIREFFITDYTFSYDDKYAYDPESYGVEDWIATTPEGFIEDGLRYDYGNFYNIGPDGGVATHATFALANPDTLFQDDPDADQFAIVLYDCDPDGDGNCGPENGETDWSAYDIAGFGEYILTGEEEPFELLTVELEDPVSLKENGCYTLMVEYDGTDAGIGIPPEYVYGGTQQYIGLSSIVFTDQLYNGGWAGNFHGLIRLHLDGFDPTIVSSAAPLDASKVEIMPNPASDYINIVMNLANEAAVVEVGLMNVMGSLIEVQQFDNVKETTLNFDVSNLSAGTYFFAIRTPEGFRTEKFVVSK